jgi:RecQ family ATP-dependent DNA helicase
VDARDALRRHFGFPEFRPGQEAALRRVLAGRDALVVMPTGSGKSLIYQLAALLLPGTAVVVSPLIALMKDQADGLARRGIAAAFINSSLAPDERACRLRALADGRYRIVLVAPERLRGRAFREALKPLPISLLAVDEAQCLSQWGHDFRPDYLHIADVRRELAVPVTLALTATATPRIQDDIIRLLGLPDAERLVGGFDRPNLTFEVLSAPDVRARLNRVAQTLAGFQGAGIIYTGTRRDAEEVAEFVRQVVGLRAEPYHAALDTACRSATEEAFLRGDLPIVVATNAFGMGIDRPDVRLVLHYTMPATLEAYYQEAGRAGRDDLPARAVLLYSPRDTALPEYFADSDVLSVDDLRTIHRVLQAAPPISLEAIGRATGLRRTGVRVALEYLESAAILRRGPDEPDGLLRVSVAPLEDAVLQALGAQIAAQRERRHQQVSEMEGYAKARGCRRRALLDHFGDPGPADTPRCCDRCLASGGWARIRDRVSALTEALSNPDSPARQVVTCTLGKLRAVAVIDIILTLIEGLVSLLPSTDPGAAFLARPHPRRLNGPWLAGWALDFHSSFDGERSRRSAVGDLVVRYKYRGERRLASKLAAHWTPLLAAQPELPRPEVVIAVPPSTLRDFDPVTLLAQALAARLGIPAFTDALVKIRTTEPQKEMLARGQKRANVAGAFAVEGDLVGKHLILVDDLYDSGATLTEAARVLGRAGAASLVVLTLTKTIHADG